MSSWSESVAFNLCIGRFVILYVAQPGAEKPTFEKTTVRQHYDGRCNNFLLQQNSRFNLATSQGVRKITRRFRNFAVGCCAPLLVHISRDNDEQPCGSEKIWVDL